MLLFEALLFLPLLGFAICLTICFAGISRRLRRTESKTPDIP